MNAKLVESLADAVVALPPEDYSLFQEKLTDRVIHKTPGVASGDACIRNTQVAVWMLIFALRQGKSEIDLLKKFSDLTYLDLLSARAYYQTNRHEIDELLLKYQPLGNQLLATGASTVQTRYRQAGSAAGQIWMSPDFEESLEDFQDYMQ